MALSHHAKPSRGGSLHPLFVAGFTLLLFISFVQLWSLMQGDVTITPAISSNNDAPVKNISQLDGQQPNYSYQNHAILDGLPTCQELMQQPASPYADGSFLMQKSTEVVWKIRRDFSRELTLPHTCQLKRYTAIEAKQCLKKKHLLFLGDSLTRYQYMSLAYFMEHSKWPLRFNVQSPCNHVDEDGKETCSTRQEPNICAEGDWPGGWPQYQQNLGGGTDGGYFHGRMESHSTRDAKYSGDNCQYVTVPLDDLELDSRTKLSFVAENGWGNDAVFSSGWRYTGCAYNGTCRYTPENYQEYFKKADEKELDWYIPNIVEAFGVWARWKGISGTISGC